MNRDQSGLWQKKAPFQGKKSTFLAKKAPISQTKSTFGGEKKQLVNIILLVKIGPHGPELIWHIIS